MAIVETLFPVFVVVLIGFVLVRSGILSTRDIDGVSRLVFSLLIPILLFNALSHVELPAQLNWRFFLSYYLVALSIYGIGMLLSKRYFAYSQPEQGVFGMGSAYSNLVLVGLPILSAGFGEEALLPLFMIVSIHAAVMFFIVALVVDSNGEDDRRVWHVLADTLAGLARNPIIVGLVLGLAVNLLNVRIPAPLESTLEMVGRATLPCALLVLGGSLNNHRPSGHFTEAWTMIGLKMILQPLLVWVLAFQVFHLQPLWGAVAVMAAGMPVGVNAYMAAQKYQVVIATTSTAFLFSTLLAGISQSFLLAVFLS